MKRRTPGIAVALILTIAAFALTVQAAPPELMVSEQEMERHLVELGISGEAANNVRAAWGRMAFNLERLGEASEMVAAWRNTGGILMNFFPREEGDLRDAYNRYNEIAQPLRRAHGWWEHMLPLLAVERYFSELERAAAARRDAAAALRRAHLRTRLPRQPEVITRTCWAHQLTICHC